MSKFTGLFLVSITLAATMVCAGKAGERDVNKIHAAVEEVWNKGNYSMIEQYVSPDIVRRGPGQRDSKGIENYRKHVENFRTAFPDLKLEFLDTVSEGDRGASHWVMSGTHKGVLLLESGEKIKPTGKRMVMRGASFVKWKDEKMVEEFAVADVLGTFQQLGLMPPPEKK